MIRKFFPFFLTCILFFCACGTTAVSSEVSSASVSNAIGITVESTSSVPTEEDISGPVTSTSETSSEQLASDSLIDMEQKKEIAISLIGQDVSLLYDALGEPISAEYTMSCNGPGDDGLLTYDGFIVFTYRENGVETVFDVL